MHAVESALCRLMKPTGHGQVMLVIAFAMVLFDFTCCSITDDASIGTISKNLTCIVGTLGVDTGLFAVF